VFGYGCIYLLRLRTQQEKRKLVEATNSVTTMEKPTIDPDTLLTSHQVGGLIQVNPTSVNKWVEEGLIPAFRTPGGHRRIKAIDLIAFLDAHKMPIPRDLEVIARRRLLIVDDDTKMLKALERTAKKYAHRLQVLTVTNGIDALVQVGAFKPHLIVLDVIMPEIDGLEVCRRLKANPETAAIAVVVTSAQLKPDTVKKATEAGAAQCLPKPIELTALFQILGISQQAVLAQS
jgi:CheY-like chemotaxis protein